LYEVLYIALSVNLNIQKLALGFPERNTPQAGRKLMQEDIIILFVHSASTAKSCHQLWTVPFYIHPPLQLTFPEGVIHRQDSGVSLMFSARGRLLFTDGKTMFISEVVQYQE